MSEVLIGLSIAYILLTALLLLALVYSRLAFVLKLALVIMAMGLYWTSYQGWKETQGWPTATTLPERFLLHYAVIQEPDKNSGEAGAIYIWASDLRDSRPAPEPRAYQLEYDQGTHGKVEQALLEIQNGNLQLGFMPSSDDLQAVKKEQKRAGQKYIGLEFSKLPDPALPEK